MKDERDFVSKNKDVQKQPIEDIQKQLIEARKPKVSYDEVFVIENNCLTKYRGCDKDIVIPTGVTAIGSYAFEGRESLTSVTIPEGVTSIGVGAFYDCRSLKSITIPNGVTTIKVNTFSRCESLKSITIPEGVTSIGAGAFCCCHSLESITIPESLTSIEYEAFEGRDSLSEELRDRIKAIEPFAFEA